jgi:hypothetical protein
MDFLRRCAWCGGTLAGSDPIRLHGEHMAGAFGEPNIPSNAADLITRGICERCSSLLLREGGDRPKPD